MVQMEKKSSAQVMSPLHSRSEKRVERERRLEDYLDTNLLSAIRAEIGVKRERDGEKKTKEIGFNWPVNELKALVHGKVPITGNGEVDRRDGNSVINGVDDVEDDVSVGFGFNWPVNELKVLVDGEVAINGAVDISDGSGFINGVEGAEDEVSVGFDFNWPDNYELKVLVDGEVSVNGADDVRNGNNVIDDVEDDVAEGFDMFGRFEETARLKGHKYPVSKF